MSSRRPPSPKLRHVTESKLLQTFTVAFRKPTLPKIYPPCESLSTHDGDTTQSTEGRASRADPVARGLNPVACGTPVGFGGLLTGTLWAHFQLQLCQLCASLPGWAQPPAIIAPLAACACPRPSLSTAEGASHSGRRPGRKGLFQNGRSHFLAVCIVSESTGAYSPSWGDRVDLSSLCSRESRPRGEVNLPRERRSSG